MTEEERKITLLKILMLHKDKINKDLDYIIYDKKKTYEMNVIYNQRSRMFDLSALSIPLFSPLPRYPLIIAEKECYVPPNELKETKTVIDINKKNKTAETIRYIKEYGIVSKEYIREYGTN